MKAQNLTDRQITELCDSVGKMLVTELDSEAVKSKVSKLVSDFVKKNKLDMSSTGLVDKLRWHVRVELKK